MWFYSRIVSACTKQTTSTGSGLLGWEKQAFFSTSECCPPREGTGRQVKREHGLHGEEQRLLHSQPSHPIAAALPVLQNFSPYKAGQPKHIGTAKSDFSWAAEESCTSCSLNEWTVSRGAEINLEISSVSRAVEEHSHHTMAWWQLMVVGQSFIPILLTKVGPHVSSQIISDIATSFLQSQYLFVSCHYK